MTNAFAAQFEAIAHAKFQAAGVADLAVYAAPDSDPISNVRVYVDRGVQTYGVDLSVVVPQTQISILRADVNMPVRSATLTIGAEVFTLDQAVNTEDEGRTTWVVTQ